MPAPARRGVGPFGEYFSAIREYAPVATTHRRLSERDETRTPPLLQDRQRSHCHAIEALGAVSTSPGYKPSVNDRDLCFARTCYDHLAGELGVKLTAALERDRVIVPSGERDYVLTKRGDHFLATWKIDTSILKDMRRAFAPRCLDWTERRYHLAGALGAAICDKFLELRWITREKKTRVVHLTVSGRRELAHLLSL